MSHEKNTFEIPSQEDIQKAMKEARLETGKKYSNLTRQQFMKQMELDEKAMREWENKNNVKFKVDNKIKGDK